MDKVLVFSDVHIPYQDDKAVQVMHEFAKDYKPDKIFINGDLLDFYRLSTFDQDPGRRDTVTEETYKTREFLFDLRKRHPKAKITYLQGNHENRLQRYLWRNPELAGLDSLDLRNLLELSNYKISEVKVDRDYWSKTSGHVKQGDIIIMHGDSRLNGAKGGGYSGYAAKNTMLNGVNSSVILGHTHRGATIFHTTANGVLTGMEGGCLCQMPPNANWQQGFITFETDKGKNSNYRFHRISNGVLKEGTKTYPKKKKK
ncbi:MAG: metallophosphoesterase [Candidatus Njordarchaeales archaeon]